MSARLELTGRRFGRLTVVAFAGISSDRRARWSCLCDCGNEVIVIGRELRRGNTRSCGCLARTNNLKHGHTRHGSISGEYRSWAMMIQRCTNRNLDRWPDYGGRGITVCDRWLHSFENFLADVGPRPSPFHSLDRFPDPNGNYEPGNVRWATREQQRANRRDSRRAA